MVDAAERVPSDALSPADLAAHALAAGGLLPAPVVARLAECAARRAGLAAAPRDSFRWWDTAVGVLERDESPDLAYLATACVRRAEAAVGAGIPNWEQLAERALEVAVARPADTS